MERPLPLWGALPLTELAVFLAIVGAIVGWLVGGRTGTVVVIGAFALGSLAGLELAVREHFSGYRSHTSLLAGLIALVVMVVLFVAVPTGTFGPLYRLAIVAAVFAAVFPFFRRAFKRRSGGAGFR